MIATPRTVPCPACDQPLPEAVDQAAKFIYASYATLNWDRLERRIAQRLERGPVSEQEAEDELWEFLGFTGSDLVAAVQHYARECGR